MKQLPLDFCEPTFNQIVKTQILKIKNETVQFHAIYHKNNLKKKFHIPDLVQAFSEESG